MSNLPLLVSFTHWKGVWQWGNRTGIRLNLSRYGRHTVIRQIPLTVRWWGHKSLDLHSIPVSCTNVPESCFIASFDNYKRVKTRWTCQRLSDAIVRKKVQRRICFKAAPGFESRQGNRHHLSNLHLHLFFYQLWLLIWPTVCAQLLLRAPASTAKQRLVSELSTRGTSLLITRGLLNCQLVLIGGLKHYCLLWPSNKLDT